MSDLTKDDYKDSARRIAGEAFFQRWLTEARQRTSDLLQGAKTHEDLLFAQAWHQAVDDLETAVRRASKP